MHGLIGGYAAVITEDDKLYMWGEVDSGLIGGLGKNWLLPSGIGALTPEKVIFASKN